ncbi:MAG: NTP transferase domain-containing protein [Candidatus Aureabacteria bacterium]|nr:NTP transferase domain-containing protein [Candidatus Auribacterota bacterium]
MNDSVIVVQARMESTRLPGKVLLPLAGKPLIFHLLERLSSIPCQGLCVAISDAKASDRLNEILVQKGYSVFRGHPTNVYLRFLNAVKKYSASVLVRVTADNPLTDCEAIKKGMQLIHEQDLDYVWMTHCPVGCGCDIFKMRTFLSFENASLTEEEKEHIVPIFRNRKELKGMPVSCGFPKEAEQLRLTVDTQDDYQQMDQLVNKYIQQGSLELDRVIREKISSS